VRLVIQIKAIADQFVEVDFGWTIRPTVTASVAAGAPIAASTLTTTSFTPVTRAARASISARARRTIPAIYLLCFFSHFFNLNPP
jgi:hypothetical protein